MRHFIPAVGDVIYYPVVDFEEAKIEKLTCTGPVPGHPNIFFVAEDGNDYCLPDRYADYCETLAEAIVEFHQQLQSRIDEHMGYCRMWADALDVVVHY